MISNFDFLNILYFCLFTTLIFFQQLHIKNFRGSSKSFEMLLVFFAFIGIATGLTFLIYYGLKVVWWAPFILAACSLLFQLVSGFLERFFGGITLSLIGFIACPVLVYLMFTSVPK